MRSDLESTVSSDGVQTNCGPDHVALRLASCLGRAANWLEAHVSHGSRVVCQKALAIRRQGLGDAHRTRPTATRTERKATKTPWRPRCFSATAVNFPTSPK